MSDTEDRRPVPSYARPLASMGSKQSDRIFKLISNLNEEGKSKALVSGVKFVNKAIRKDRKGFLVLAADTQPLDVIAHLPVYCEQKGVSYIFVERRSDIGKAMLRKRSFVALYVLEPTKDSKHKKLYDKVAKAVKKVAKGTAEDEEEE